MSLKLLVSTIDNKNILDFLDSLNVQPDAIVINQCDKNEYKRINYKDNNIDFSCTAYEQIGEDDKKDKLQLSS